MNDILARKPLSFVIKDLIRRLTLYRVVKNLIKRSSFYPVAADLIKRSVLCRWLDRIRLLSENDILYSDPINQERVRLADYLRDEVRALPLLSPAVADDAGSFWTENRARLRRAMLEKDPVDFLTWDIIRETIFGGGGCYAEELAALDDRILRATRESRVGLPKRCAHDKRTSGAMVRHGYHIAQFERYSGIPISSITSVFEFGGGYGGMCKVLHNLGFQGSYTIFDFPELHALQKYYLGMHNIGPASREGGQGKDAIMFIADITNLDVLPVQNNRTSLFIGTWSISETPEKLRRQVFAHPAVRSIRNFIIAYQKKFFELDNQKFFDEVRQSFTRQQWDHFEIKHFPDNYYLIGTMPEQVRGER